MPMIFTQLRNIKMIWLQGDGKLFAMKVLCKKKLQNENRWLKFPVFSCVDFALRHAVMSRCHVFVLRRLSIP